MSLLDDPVSELTPPQRRHLSRLLRTWSPLADIAFADLLLCVPVPATTSGATSAYRVVGQVRPTTGRSIHRTDLVGELLPAGSRPFFDLARTSGAIVDGGMIGHPTRPRIRTLTVPVRCDGEIIAVLSREFSPDEQRAPGELEMNYFVTFRRLAQMIAEGSYPFDFDEAEVEEAPRVSDGLVILDAAGRVRFASPNSVSVFARIGIRRLEGERLANLGFHEQVVRLAFSTRLPQTEEVEHGSSTVMVRCHPIIEGGELTGALVFVRDISELRRRDQLLVSKDATIAEIHHRVKNNLQTISSLLRLQGRRVVAEEARTAIEESVRRIRAIAVVHEILSREVADDVTFDDIVRPLVRLVEEGLSSPDQPVTFSIEGEAGQLPSTTVTSLAVVLSELVQNAVEHGFGEPAASDARVTLRFTQRGDQLEMVCEDNGVGVSEPFALDEQSGLGLTIVRSLVEQDLGGTIAIGRVGAEGTRVTVTVDRQSAGD